MDFTNTVQSNRKSSELVRVVFGEFPLRTTVTHAHRSRDSPRLPLTSFATYIRSFLSGLDCSFLSWYPERMLSSPQIRLSHTSSRLRLPLRALNGGASSFALQ